MNNARTDWRAYTGDYNEQLLNPLDKLKNASSFFLTLSDGTEAASVLTQGPICIANEYKRKGYGKILLDYSLEKAKALRYGAVCFEGNIDFYGKSGFDFASKFGIRYAGFTNEMETRQTSESRAENEVSLDQTYHGLPEGMEADFFLCKELKAGYLDGITGVYATPKPYFVAEENHEDFEVFDAGFRTKWKPGKRLSQGRRTKCPLTRRTHNFLQRQNN